MSLVSKVKYETSIKKFEDISPDSVLSMLRDVGADIKKLDDSFQHLDLEKVRQTIEKGEYIIKGKVSTIIDLSEAKEIIEQYREDSEGGCQSCQKLGSEVIDAMDADIGYYCEVADPDCKKGWIPEYQSRVTYSGNSPKVKKYYHNPCKDWKPTFSPTLEVLISKQR
jgi:hypothetical protein